jgi:23S rRNA pseudouridine1911/1915/1917 synthase
VSEFQTFEVSPQEAGHRLDQFLAQASGLSRSTVYRLIDEGRVRLQGRPPKASYRVRAKDRITVSLPPPSPSGLEPEPIPLHVLYEDQDLLVLNKPSGVVVHPAAGHRSGTLVNALLYHYPELPGIGGVERPGIVHRLDRETSGCLMVAKTERAHQVLTRQFQMRQIEKKYLALVHGIVRDEARSIILPIGRHEAERKKMGVRTRKGREAETTYRVLRRLDGYTLLEVSPTTGRTHQIRVHLSAIGHPVVGDTLYGGRRERKTRLKAPRQLLHAWKLSFTHPGAGHRIEVTAPLPADFQNALESLGMPLPLELGW